MSTTGNWNPESNSNSTEQHPSPTSATTNGGGTTTTNNNSQEDLSNDAEGVWSPDIEQSFQEALAIYPPCGRRKIILSDEGKMYGRNELIARYIKLRTGKTRSRKQVSSHIQVLARRKTKEIQASFKDHLAGANEFGNTERAALHHLQISNAMGIQDPSAKDKVLQSMASMSSAQIVSASAIHNKAVAQGLAGIPPTMGPTYTPYGSQVRDFWNPSNLSQDVKPPYGTAGFPDKSPTSVTAQEMTAPPWQGRSIAGPKLRLVEFSAFLEQQRDPDSYRKHLFVHIDTNSSYSDPLLEAVDIRQIYDKFPEKKGGLKELYDKGPSSAFFLVKFWADLNTNVPDETGAYYGVSSQYESSESMTITCSTKVCSFGKQVVEKVETEYPRFENGRYVYRIHRSPMCEYMINFIHKLKHLPEKYMMNSVLENFTILQVVTNRDTQETLLCNAFVFEVSTSVHGAQHHIYRLVKD